MPLTPFQRQLPATLASTANEDRYLAGGAAMRFTPQSTRYSDDLDFFHDSESRVAAAFAQDRETLTAAAYAVDIGLVLPGFVRAVVSRGSDATQVDWAHDSAWRFMPLVRDDLGGLLLHPVDLATNKVLALAGRDEPRDFVDILFVHRTVLPLAGLAWAATGKDPDCHRSRSSSCSSATDVSSRRLRRLQLTEPFDLVGAKRDWLSALARAESFARERLPEESGCLYYSPQLDRFVLPASDSSLEAQGVVPHFGQPGGVLPRITDEPLGDLR